MPAKIVVQNDGYKKFQNITVHTQVGFQIECEFWQAKVICIFITGQSLYFCLNSKEFYLLSPYVIYYSMLLIQYGKLN